MNEFHILSSKKLSRTLQQVHASPSEHFPGSDKHKSCGYKQVPACCNSRGMVGHNHEQEGESGES